MSNWNQQLKDAMNCLPVNSNGKVTAEQMRNAFTALMVPRYKCPGCGGPLSSGTLCSRCENREKEAGPVSGYEKDDLSKDKVWHPDGRVWCKSIGGHLCLHNEQDDDRYTPSPETYLTPEEAFRPGALVRWTDPKDGNIHIEAYVTCWGGSGFQYAVVMGISRSFNELTLVTPAPEDNK